MSDEHDGGDEGCRNDSLGGGGTFPSLSHSPYR